MRPAHPQRLVVTIREHVGKFGSQFEETPGPGELQVTVGPVLHEVFPIGGIHRRQHGSALLEIHRPPVIGIDQRQIPELGALVEIGHAGDRCLQRDLTERIQRTQQRDAPRQGFKRTEKFRRGRAIQNPLDECP